MFCANFARIEGSYYQVENLMALPVRKVLNLTYTWLFDLIGGTEQWTKDYAPVFDPNAAEDFDYVDIPQAPPTPSSDSSTQPRTRLLMGGY